MAKPPARPAEWPVSADDMDRIADEALGLEPQDLLDAGPDEDLGFGLAAAEARQRVAVVARRERLLPSARDVLSHRRKATFLANLAVTGNVTMACAAAGWSSSIAYGLRKADADFAEKWEVCAESAADLLEMEALRRAVHGVERPVFQQGREVGRVVEYSDSLLAMLLKAAKRKKYSDRVEVDSGGNKGGVLVIPAAPSQEDWEAQASAQQRKYREQEERT